MTCDNTATVIRVDELMEYWRDIIDFLRRFNKRPRKTMHALLRKRVKKRSTLFTLVCGIAVILTFFYVLFANAFFFFTEASAANSITICIKTVSSFRGRSFHLLYDSIRARYPNVPILAADDSVIPKNIGLQKYTADKQFSFFSLPPNVGVSASRNYMLERVNTPFFMNMDDDMIFSNATDLLKILKILKGTSSPDILTLGVEQHSKIVSYQHIFKFTKSCKQHGTTEVRLTHNLGKSRSRTFLKGRAQPLVAYLEPLPESKEDVCVPTDIGMNIFVAKTESLRRMEWNPSMSQYDHEFFFLRAKLFGLRIESCPQYSLVHAQHRSASYNYYKSNRNLTVTTAQGFCEEFSPNIVALRSPYWTIVCMSKSIAIMEWKTECSYDKGMHWFRGCEATKCLHVNKQGFGQPKFEPVADDRQLNFGQNYVPKVHDFGDVTGQCNSAGWVQFAFWAQNSGCLANEVSIK